MTMTYLMSDVTPILNFCGNAVGGSSLDKGASTIVDLSSFRIA